MITLTFGTFHVQLRNPDFGDRESVEVRRINRKTRGGDLIIYRDLAWPLYSTYTWKFSFLAQADLDRLLYFLKLSLGQVIVIIDYEGRTFNAIITTPTDEVSQEGVEEYHAGFSFQVTL